MEGVARGAGRVRAAVAPARGGGDRRRRVRRRDLPGRRRRSRARPGVGTRRRAPPHHRARRGPACRHLAGRAGQAAPGVRVAEGPQRARHRAGHGDRGQQLADLGRRRRADPRFGGRGQALQPAAAGALRRLRVARRAARNHGHRPDRGDSGGAESHRPEARRPRLDRAQRGVRGAVAGGDRELRPRPGTGQSAGRRDRARPSARRHRRDTRVHDDLRPAPAQAEVRHGHDVRRHRPRRGRHFRGAVRRPGR